MNNFMSELMLLLVNQILEDEVKEKGGDYQRLPFDVPLIR